jgi:tetratricopeptide (TPR) repeat protein
MCKLADANLWWGKEADSLRLCEEAVQVANSHLKPGDAARIEALKFLAGMYFYHAQMDKHVQVCADIFALVSSERGPDHPDTFAALEELGHAYCYVKRFDDSIRILKDEVTRNQDVFGLDHPNTFRSMSRLGDVLQAAKKANEAIEIYEQANRINTEKHKSSEILSQLADAYLLAGRFNDALEASEESLRIARASAASKSACFTDGTKVMRVACIKLKMDRPSDAETLVQGFLQDMRDVLPEDDPEISRANCMLSLVLIQKGNFKDAEEAVRGSMAFLEKQYKPTNWRYCLAQGMLGSALARREKFADAKPLLVPAYVAIEPYHYRFYFRPILYEPFLSEVLQSLADCCEALGEPAEALKWNARLAELQQTAYGPASN